MSPSSANSGEPPPVPLPPQQQQQHSSASTKTPSSSSSSVATAAYRVVPLIQRSTLTRYDVGPFLVGYIGCILLDHRITGNTDTAASSSSITSTNTVTILYSLLLVTHISLVLLSQWYVSVRVAIGYSHPSATPHCDYTHCFVQPIQSASVSNSEVDTANTARGTAVGGGGGGGGGIVPIRYEAIAPEDYSIISTTQATNTPIMNHQTPNHVMTITFHDRVFRAYTRRIDVTNNDNRRCILDDRTLWQQQLPQPQQQQQQQQQQPQEKTPQEFRPIEYPIHLPLAFYTKQWKGHASLQSCRIAQSIYGSNTTVISLPTIYQLLQQQLVQPLFIFQLLCVLLWCCDEYWYYAIYTLFALLLLECTLSYSKLKGLQRLHTIGNRNQHQKVYVRRGMSASISSSKQSPSSTYLWMKILVSELMPGDIISLSVYQEAISVPADVVLLHGTAVCDEALLTGESIPQRKQPLQSASHNGNKDEYTDECLDINDIVYKESILFGGTTLLVTTSEDDNKDTNNSTAKHLSMLQTNGTTVQEPPPPDQGIIGMVIRTGFETTQGNLLRTMVHSSSSGNNNETHNTMDTFVFIALLLLCAIGAAMYVLSVGWHDERRNHFRLILHVIMIITSVVPPELPMELSLAITNSVGDLIRRCHVYCTEHYRIPYAGQVNICCFDKTGTLTSDEMQLKGVRIFDTEPAKTCDTTATINIADEDNALKRPLENENIPLTTLRIMAACHSLAAANISRSSKGDTKKKNQMQVIGDPLEQTVLRESGYRLTGNSIVDPIEAIEVDVSSRHSTTTTTDDRRRRINILHRFAFSSKLKRMTVLCTEGDANVMGSAIWAVSKGAPETIKDLLSISSIPINYDDVAYHHMSRGRRVLAMAYRDAGTIRNLQSLKDGGREKVEYNLIFAGFLVLDCPLKSDSKSVVSDLRKSGLDVVMITGDAILTAAEVARQVGILRKPTAGKRTVYEIRKKENDTAISANNDPLNCLEYIPLGRTGSTQSQNQELLIHPLRNDNIAYLRRIVINHEVAFCISGDTLVTLALTALSMEHGQTTKQALVDEKILLLSTPAQKALQKLVPIISVFARHAPHQKEAVVAAFNSAGYCTLMCGDGTNDVGALKRAHVGISIISAPNVEKKQRNANANIAKVKTDDRVATMKKSGKTTKKSTTSQKVLTIEESLRQLRQAQEELDQVELGDASVAAPFTSRAVSIKCCKDVIQQGRCTLVTMLQIYKILGINCLVNAFVLSELFLHGVKQGDRQLTILGMAVASLFYFVTRAEPLPTLSTIQPPASVLCSEALLSIVGQCFIHIMMTALITECALSYIDPFDPSLVPDGPFNPNVLNTCTFLITCVAAINTFAVNYYGRPYMKDVHENKLFYRTIQILYGLVIVCSLEVFIPLNDLLQLTTLPNILENNHIYDSNPNSNRFLRSILPLDLIIQQLSFPGFMTVTMILDTILSFSFERSIRRIYVKTTK